MNNILDYITWRGDIDFSESPFNEVDNLIFTQLSYLDFSGIVSSEIKEYISLKAAWDKYEEIGRKPESVILPEEIYTLFKLAAQSERFSGIKLSGFVAHLDETKEKQFAALTIIFNKQIYVSFRGTDDNIVGWKEDFNLAFMESIPAQREAARYLDRVMKEVYFLPVYIGGHSKGGNLSLYSAMHCKKIHKRRIKKIYTNDSPGFSDKVIESKEYKEAIEKVISIVPEGSVIGQLLSHGRKDDIIVKNKSSLLRQHDPFTWEVMGTGFVKVEELNSQSIATDEIISSWLSGMDKKDRESFVEALFELLTVADAKSLIDISKDKLGFIRSLGKLSKEAKKDLGKNFAQLLEQIAKSKVKR